MRFDLSPEGDLLVYETDDKVTLRTQGNPIAGNLPFNSLAEAMDYYHNVLNWQGQEAEIDPVVEPTDVPADVPAPNNTEEGI